ncbi:hypothetical protein LTR60_003194 [Cryomyces antarcticus]|nr:hypothetical protein LTR60_003194 [Cryomyces antarcticus]
MSSISKIVQSHRPDLSPYISLYKHLHAYPELSHQEKETAATAHSRLSKLHDFTLYPDIGGHGLAAVLENGAGPTVLLRADMDGLPVEEQTGLPYASTARVVDEADGVEKPVMHACGHDMHVTSLLAAAELLYSAKAEWGGTLVLVFQPAEEKGAGAQRMVDDGLYERVPVPDVVLGGHVMPYRSGTIGTKRGLMASAADSMAVTLHGRGGHASQPHRTVDPIVMAASTILRLQTIVSRELDASTPTVLTVYSIHAGDAENIIPASATLKLNLRTLDASLRTQALSAIKRILAAEARASDAPAPPTITPTSTFPFTVNDAAATATHEAAFGAHFEPGEHGYSADAPRLSGSEDFGVLASAVLRPSSFWIYGGTDPAVWDDAERKGCVREDVPINHSAWYAPAVMPTLRVAVDAYAVAALAWLAKGEGK